MNFAKQIGPGEVLDYIASSGGRVECKLGRRVRNGWAVDYGEAGGGPGLILDAEIAAGYYVRRATPGTEATAR